MTIFMIFTVIENSCWFENCNQQIRLRLMFFSLSSKRLIESMEYKIKEYFLIVSVATGKVFGQQTIVSVARVLQAPFL